MDCSNIMRRMPRRASARRREAVSRYIVSWVWVLAFIYPSVAPADTVVHWDFTKGLLGWKGNAYVEGLTTREEGLVFRSTGQDPWIEGPAMDLPTDRLIRVTVRMRSNANASGEMFYGPTFRAGHSVQFVVQSDGRWHDYEMVVAEPLGKGTRFRLDPASSTGEVAVASILVEALARPSDVPFEKPVRPMDSARPGASVMSGPLTLNHMGRGLGDFRVCVDGQEVATGYQAEVVGLVFDGQAGWLRFNGAPAVIDDVNQGHFSVRASLTDGRGGHWAIQRVVHAGPVPGTIVVESRFEVDADRDVIYLPWLTVYCGLGTFGGHKTQAVFPGLEYLEDEFSSSQADIRTPDHVRRMPDPVKVTFPLMALVAQGTYMGLIWEPSALASPLFDSPDRMTGTDAHVMAVTGPAVGRLRFENTLAAHSPMRLGKGQTLSTRVTIIGGRGDTVAPAVQHYVTLCGMPDLPSWKGGLQSAAELLSHGWIDSEIREGGLFRHAVWGDSFRPGAAADAAMYMDWLAALLDPNHAAVIDALKATRDLAHSALSDGDPYASAVSHVRLPVAPLVFGRVEAFVRGKVDHARRLLKGFDEHGIKIYMPGKTDYGTTHFARHANGYSAGDLAAILEAATLSGQVGLTRDAIDLLDRQTAAYRGTVPRGAQTWEVPLHTPDILASAYMTRAYCLGYILSGRQEHLDQARYWAWTGVPFVYLVNPTEGEVGRYATIPVFGATDWQGSWFGRPVQWCGLVYASALHLLSRYDPTGPWAQVAKGITLTGLQMSWPTTDKARQGLLPDFYHLNGQISDGPAINPGTVGAHVPEVFDKGAMYDLQRLVSRGWLIHAPCAILDVNQSADTVTMTVAGWGASGSDRPYRVLISGVSAKPDAVERCRLGRPEQDRLEPAPFDFDASLGLLIIEAAGPMKIRVSSFISCGIGRSTMTSTQFRRHGSS